MDSKAQRKALFRSKLREISQKRERRIDSPLVRYNEDDQPVCRVCNIILKSESLWPAHLASRKHHEAVENFKAAAAAARQTTTSNLQPANQQNLHEARVTTLPDNFFDSLDSKKRKSELDRHSTASGPGYSSMSKEVDQNIMMGNYVQPSEQMGLNDVMQAKAVLPESFSDKGTDEGQNYHKSPISNKGVLEVNQDKEPGQLKEVKGELPAGFFDNKDSDLRARGIEPVKVDIDVAYKEFEKEIQEDLQEVDDRLEEEEIDAAEIRDEIEHHEQKAYRERVEMMKGQLLQAKEVSFARQQKRLKLKGMDSGESSDDDEEDDGEDFSVDWRAKRL